MVNHGHDGLNPGGEVNDVEYVSGFPISRLRSWGIGLPSPIHYWARIVLTAVTSFWSQAPPVARKSLQTDSAKCFKKEGGHMLKCKYSGTMGRALCCRETIAGLLLDPHALLLL